MRFKEFLIREDTEDFGFREALMKVKQECEYFLGAIHTSHNFLYRGMNEPVVDRALFLPHRPTRKPRDSTEGFNGMFNAGIELSHGINLVRSKALFCTPDKREATEYGNVYFIFPKGKFEFLWSPMISDSYVDETKFEKLLAEKLGIEIESTDFEIAKYGGRIKKAFWLMASHANDNPSTLVNEILHRDEVVEEAFKQVGVEVDAKKFRAVLKEIFEGMYTDKSLLDALESGHEILITKSEGFYAIPREGLKHDMEMDHDLDGQSPEEFVENFLFPGGRKSG